MIKKPEFREAKYDASEDGLKWGKWSKDGMWMIQFWPEREEPYALVHAKTLATGYAKTENWDELIGTYKENLKEHIEKCIANLNEIEEETQECTTTNN